MGTFLLILAGITLLSLFTPNQSAIIASWLDLLRVLIGWGRYVFWLALVLLAFWFFKRYSTEDQDEKWEKPVGTLLIMGLLLAVFHLIQPGDGLVEAGGGGLIGWAVGEMLLSALGLAGAIVLIIGLIPLVIILISGLSLRELYGIIRDLYYRFQDWRHFRQLTINQPLPRSRSPELKTKFIDRILPMGSRAAPK
ncbi:MAG TPA: DNA translocase FtsK 4TM domain-containing protein, partial [Anaerolineae bacterium]